MRFDDLDLLGVCIHQRAFARTLFAEPFNPGVAARVYFQHTANLGDLGRVLMAVCLDRDLDPAPWLQMLSQAAEHAATQSTPWAKYILGEVVRATMAAAEAAVYASTAWFGRCDTAITNQVYNDALAKAEAAEAGHALALAATQRSYVFYIERSEYNEYSEEAERVAREQIAEILFTEIDKLKDPLCSS